MAETRKASAGSGAEWLLGGFSLLRHSLLGLGLLGAIFGLLSALPMLFAASDVRMFFALQVLLVLLGPVLMGGFIYAVHEVESGRSAVPGHLLQGFREGKALRLLALLLPQVAVGVIAVLLLLVMVGPAQLQEAVLVLEQIESQPNPDPAVFEQLPVGAFLLWLLVVFVLGVLAYFFTFVATPQIMLEHRDAFTSMKRSFRACVRSIPAMIVFFVLLLIIAFLVSLGAQLVAVIARVAAGPVAMQFLSQLLLMAVLMPVMMGATYRAWRQLLPSGEPGSAAEAPPPSGIEA